MKRPTQTNSFYAPDIQLTKNVWAPTTIYIIGYTTHGYLTPARQNNNNPSQNLDEHTKTVANSKLSEILNNRMKLYKKNN